jgi:hypothetical protein
MYMHFESIEPPLQFARKVREENEVSLGEALSLKVGMDYI